MNNVKKEFIKECLNNRNYLEFTYKDMANCLVGVSEKEYKEFEAGNYNMSIENARRLVKVLCIKKPMATEIEKYLDFSNSELSKSDIDDIKNIAIEIVGGYND